MQRRRDSQTRDEKQHAGAGDDLTQMWGMKLKPAHEQRRQSNPHRAAGGGDQRGLDLGGEHTVPPAGDV